MNKHAHTRGGAQVRPRVNTTAACLAILVEDEREAQYKIQDFPNSVGAFSRDKNLVPSGNAGGFFSGPYHQL